MLRFSLRRTKEPPKSREATEDDLNGTPADTNTETVRVNYTSRTWLANLRKRTLSVESLTNMFAVGRSDHGRRESANSAGGSLTGGNNTKLMRSHKMQTKSGDPVEVYFGYDNMSVNGRLIQYSDVVFWSHSASHFTMTYISKSTGQSKNMVMYPTDKGPRPSDLTDMLSARIARLVADQTGCSEEKAMRMATAKANEAELQEAMNAIQQNQGNDTNMLRKQNSRPEVYTSRSGVLSKASGSSGMVEVTPDAEEEKQTLSAPESFEEDGVGRPIPEGDEAQATPIAN